MAYYDIATMAQDSDLILRAQACASTENIADPYDWVAAHMLELASQPGWSEAWASAVAAENPAPGRDPAVITDGMILSGTQAINAGG